MIVKTVPAAILATGVGLALAGCQNDHQTSSGASGGADAYPTPQTQPLDPAEAAGATDETPVEVKQEPNQVVYWVLPGPRELDPAVFGTPENPKMTLKPVLEKAQALVDQGKAPPSVPGLLKDLPILVGVPMKARETDEQGNWVLKKPNPFSDKAKIVSGSFEATYRDLANADSPGPPGKTDDSAAMEARFTDPKGNEYRAVLDHVVKPPFPGYQTDGGVMIDGTHHGDTGTGSPLMPEVDTKAAFWGVGELYINGELAETKRVMHMMTTEVVRTRDYELVFEKDLPLPPEERQIADQSHHTHLVVLPVQAGPEGPFFKPLETAFTLPNGKPQPFIHVMFEQDAIEKGGAGYAFR